MGTLNLATLLTVVSTVLAVISTIFAVWALFGAAKQMRILNKQTEKMNKSLDKSGEMTSHLDEQTKKLENIIVNLETRHIEPFPDNFDIINGLLSYCEQNTPTFGRKRIEIFTDFAGYGILSKHSNWQKFNDKIKAIIQEGQVEVFWCFYTGDLKKMHIEQQFNILKDSPQERQKYIKKCLSNATHLCDEPPYPDCGEKDNCFVRHIHDAFAKKEVSYDDIINLATTIEDMAEADIESLKKQGKSKLKIKKLTNEKEILPYFGWFVFEERKTFKPVQAMISFPYYAESREEGLITKHKGIIEAFRSKLPQFDTGIQDVRPDRFY